MNTFTLLFFGALLVTAIVSIVKIHRQERLAARENKRAGKARLETFRAKCFRPDGD